MDKILSKLKNNWLYVIIPIIFISFLFIHLNVVYFGDDYYYLTFRNLNVADYFSKLFDHYQNDNGRFLVHMLATFFLKLPLPFWGIVNSIFLTGICYFASKIASHSQKEISPLLCVIIFFFLAFLNISITRQSVYWLTGSFNYVYPLFLFFAYWYCLTKIDNKKFFIASIFLGFLSAATMEQVAMMTFGLTILMTLSQWKGFHAIKNWSKQNKKLLLLSFLTLLGLCTVILAPSQFKRIALENAKESEEVSLQETILDNSKFILSKYTVSTQVLPYCILFHLAVILYVLKNETKKKKFLWLSLAILNCLFTLFNIATYASLNILTKTNYLLVGITLILYAVQLIYLNIKIYSKLISPLTIITILMIGSQFMMIISPVLGLRNLVSGYVLFAFLIITLISHIPLQRKNLYMVGFLLLAILANFKTASGYYQTKLTEEKNRQILAESSEILKDENQTITLYQFPNDDYAWSMPYISSYHEFYFKHLYQIKCQIHWEKDSASE